MTMAYYTKYIV